MRRGLTRVDVGMGARAVPRAGVGSRPGVNVERGVNTVGSPELGGRGAGANGGTGVSPSRGVCLTTIFTTPVLFTMVGGTARGSYIEGKAKKKEETQRMEEVWGRTGRQTHTGDTDKGKEPWAGRAAAEARGGPGSAKAWRERSDGEARSLTLVSSKRKAEASGGRGGAGGRRRQHRDRGGARGRGHGLDEGHVGRLADEVVLPPC